MVRTDIAELCGSVANGSGCVSMVDSSWKPNVTERGDLTASDVKARPSWWKTDVSLMCLNQSLSFCYSSVFSGLGSIFMNWNGLINGAMVFQCDCPWSRLPEVLSTFETTTNQKARWAPSLGFSFLFWCCLCRPLFTMLCLLWAVSWVWCFVVPLGGQS